MDKLAVRLLAEAKAGSIEAEYLLGLSYLQGTTGLERNNAKAHAHLKRAADAGNKHAAELVAGLYAKGNGIAQDMNQAFHYYTQADSCEAALQLARMYANGLGVERNLEKAMHSARHAMQIVPEAAQVIAEIEELQAREVSQFISNEMLVEAENGNPETAWLVGSAYLAGTRGLVRDDEKGARLIRIAADAGDIRSSWLLSFLIQDGRGLPKDKDKGHAMYVKLLDRRLYPSVYGEVYKFWLALPPI